MKARRLVVLAALALFPASTAIAAESVENSAEQPEPWVADYEGVEIDLRDGWDGARACITDGLETECWDSEAEMLLALAADGLSMTAPAQTTNTNGLRRQLTCPSFLRLYSGTNFSGAVLAIATRYTVLNLSAYGFNNSASSYRIGACPTAMWDGSSGTGAVYPGDTSPGASAASLGGWDNRISSVYQG